MKIFKLMIVALVAMLGFTACDKDCDHDFIEHDFTQDIVGTWTFVEDDLAEAMVIKADGSFTTTGVARGGSLYEEKGTIKVENNKVTLAFDDDNQTFEGRLEFVAGKSLSLVMFDDNDVRLTYDYCENDLSDEIVGMWVCNDGLTDDVAIMSYSDNGKMTITTAAALGTNTPLVKSESNYVVVGDLMFTQLPAANVEGQPLYTASCITYTPGATSTGDIMTHKMYTPSANGLNESVMSFLRIKQSLNLTGTYDYSSAYISNVKGKDEDFTILGHTFNMADIKGGNFDMLFRSELFCVDLNTNTITQHFLPANGQDVAIEIPTTVEGNKVTLDYSAVTSGLRKVDMYMFQDADDSQLHMYMHTDAFINYFANLEVATMLQAGEINSTDADAVEKVYTNMESRIESINVSFVLKARK